ncbi:maleylacetoacetate isomerase [Roseomonas sp. SSH11]|uniref:Maleylacetoacetate isomerase n=1 Tax=Pararoseomonas baculiformis TaxID=2820812 RepID=A0ABS4AAP5_9PROT|nr:maleylacetoacetate isomerase [Pararoseomonas baculiformis]MBP0443635.1 maleylacetoacetate isomerase [Pararoseomonas baculiformis]
MRLHGYFRSSAAWRVRIALNLKGITVEHSFHHLRRGEQRAPEFLRCNPQGLLPALETDDGSVLTQSMAIIEWLDETHPEPRLVPGTALERARIRAFAQAIACDIHPVQNLKVLARLREEGWPEEKVTGWARWVIQDGLEACEKLLREGEGPFLFGRAPTLADICLIPQLGNAKRFGADISALTRIREAAAACADHRAFIAAAPENQPDAE